MERMLIAGEMTDAAIKQMRQSRRLLANRVHIPAASHTRQMVVQYHSCSTVNAFLNRLEQTETGMPDSHFRLTFKMV